MLEVVFTVGAGAGFGADFGAAARGLLSAAFVVSSGRSWSRLPKFMIDQAFSSTQAMKLQQFEALSLARFDAADLNHDGTVTAVERKQARAAQQAQPQRQ